MSGPTPPTIDPAELADFHSVLKQSKRIIAVLGAGISASSGLATFRGTNGLWRGQDVMQVATPAGFRHDPGLVWQFYAYRRHEALRAQPNAAHHALAELARRVPGFVTLTQNVDHLSPRAGHPAAQLRPLHGSLFDLRCVDEGGCGYVERGNFADPLTPALDTAGKDETSTLGRVDPDKRPKTNPMLLAGLARKNAQILGDKYEDKGPSAIDLAPLKAAVAEEGGQEPAGARPPPPMSDIRLSSGLSKDDLPQCPQCKSNILRPGIVWFGEALAESTALEADALFAEDAEPVDLCLVIGTSSKVWPAAGYAEKARKKGARVATINIDAGDAKGLRPGKDWVFAGDAAVLLPELLKPVIGDPEAWRSIDS